MSDSDGGVFRRDSQGVVRDKTNAIESWNSRVRPAVRSRGHVVRVDASKKLLSLTFEEVIQPWTTRPRYWQQAKREFAIHFSEYFPQIDNLQSK